jgi:hypothetical protein
VTASVEQTFTEGLACGRLASPRPGTRNADRGQAYERKIAAPSVRIRGVPCLTVNHGSGSAWEDRIVLVATSPTVEVVTAGTDWAAIAAAIATGIAASIGVFGTAWQASHARQAATADLEKSINAAAQNLHASNEAEDRRALRAEKMRVYSEFQGEIDNILVSVDPMRRKRQSPPCTGQPRR